MSLSECALTVRRSLIVGASLLLGGLGCDATTPDTPDAQTADQTISSCAAISDDLSPAAQESRLDGTYAAEVGWTSEVKPACLVSDDGNTAYSFYITLDRERFTKYRRVYPAAQGCGTTFNSGGEIEVISEGVLRACGPTYTTADGTFRQAVSLVKRADGSLVRSYTFYGEGPADPLSQELIVSRRSSDSPFEDAPADLPFERYRHP